MVNIRRLRFSEIGQQTALRIAKRKYGANRYKTALAEDIDVHRQTVSSCLDKRKLCNFDTLDKICQVLDLNWENVSEPESYVSDHPNTSSAVDSLEQLVATVRQCVSDRIEHDCGIIQMSSFTISIDYLVEPHLYKLSRLPSEQFKTRHLLTGVKDEIEFERMGILPQYEERIEGRAVLLETKRLLVYASPGCGKTSYLKWLAIQCN
ncbi:MAG: helix-turn-helix domain-containing protein [Cyanobacteria bacterium P01_E01_bin.6]